MASAKALLKSLTPPFLWDCLRRFKGHAKASVFEGPFVSWDEAEARSEGWDSSEITCKTLDTALKVKRGLVEFEQDGLARRKIFYSETILAFLLLVLSRRNDQINIIDFGGGLGSAYVQNRKILKSAATPVYWHIVERPAFATLGKELFQGDDLRFHSSIDEALEHLNQAPDGVLFNSSLQYLPDPFPLIDRLSDAGMKIIALDRLLVSPANEHAVFVQHPDPNFYYRATYPVWCFSRARLVTQFRDKGFTLVEHFTLDPDAPFDHCGMIFISKSKDPEPFPT